MLHGREGELRAVDELLRQARTGASGVLLIRGEPGIGKSSLLEHAEAAAEGFTVLRGAGVESETELPFAGLHLLLLPVLDLVDELPSVQAVALRAGGPGPCAGDEAGLPPSAGPLGDLPGRRVRPSLRRAQGAGGGRR